MIFSELLHKIEDKIQNEIPFVVYRKPKETTLCCFFQKDDSIHFLTDYSKKGFVFAPFDIENKTIFLPKENCDFFEVEIPENLEINLSEIEFSEDNSAKAKHTELVQAGINFINSGIAKKVVLSRKEEVQFINLSLSKTFTNMLAMYQNAMVYVWYHPKIGLWSGATPEKLLSVADTKFQTVSLAGTQPFVGTEKVDWQEKELEEQQVVTDFIENELKSKVSKLKISKPYTIKAGNLLHLKTDISGELFSEKDLKHVIDALHPTPAVCGLPKQNSKQFILENEHYNREFYTGFLGELNVDTKTNLFVNLRCMQVKKDVVQVYVGGGVTSSSVPEKEWQETVEKSKVIKKTLVR